MLQGGNAASRHSIAGVSPVAATQRRRTGTESGTTMMHREAVAGKFAWRLRRPGALLRATQEWVDVSAKKQLPCHTARVFPRAQHTRSGSTAQRAGS